MYEDRLLSLKEAADLLGYTRQNILYHVKKGNLEKITIGAAKAYFVRLSDLERFEKSKEKKDV